MEHPQCQRLPELFPSTVCESSLASVDEIITLQYPYVMDPIAAMVTMRMVHRLWYETVMTASWLIGMAALQSGRMIFAKTYF